MKEFDPVEEEELFKNKLETVSGFLHRVRNRDPENVKSIIISGNNALVESKNHLEEWMGLPGAIGSIDDRIDLISKADEIPLFKIDPESIYHGNLPKKNVIAADSHLLEIVFGNLYMSVSLYNRLCAGDDINKFLRRFDKIVETCERARARSKKEMCYTDPTSVGRAQFVYAYELLANNVLKTVKDTHNPDILYGKEGIHYGVKNRRLFRNREKLCKAHFETYAQDQHFYFPTLRVFFTDVIPKYSLPNEYA